jgi:hypothetical protein
MYHECRLCVFRMCCCWNRIKVSLSWPMRTFPSYKMPFSVPRSFLCTSLGGTYCSGCYYYCTTNALLILLFSKDKLSLKLSSKYLSLSTDYTTTICTSLPPSSFPFSFSYSLTQSTKPVTCCHSLHTNKDKSHSSTSVCTPPPLVSFLPCPLSYLLLPSSSYLPPCVSPVCIPSPCRKIDSYYYHPSTANSTINT